MGPEDLIGGGWSLWQTGGGPAGSTERGLQIINKLAEDADAMKALSFFNVHGYGSDGIKPGGANSTEWKYWAEGWSSAPAQGLPMSVKGFAALGKKSWMTETSGEKTDWLDPVGAFPSGGAFSISLKIHQALTTGQQSAWLYWTYANPAGKGVHVDAFHLTDATLLDKSPKYVAAKHYFRYIRPNAVAIATTTAGPATLLASAYVHAVDKTLTVVLVNTAPADEAVSIPVPKLMEGATTFETVVSRDSKLWVESNTSVIDGAVGVTVPGYGVVTVQGREAPHEGPNGFM